MPEKIYIQENELRSLLDDENTIEETLKKYFVLDDSQAFKMHYKLKENVELEQDPYAPMGFIRSALIVSSNFVMRRLRNAAYRRSIRDYPERTRIVSEGDSWFQHPMLYDVIDNLSNHYSVKSLGAASDDMEDYIRDAEYLDEIRNEDPSFFLFSGGGNDIFAKGFDSFLNECTDDVHNIGAKRFVKRCLYDK